MSQNPIVLPTTGTVSGLQLVQDANAALDTLNTKWAGSSPPSSPEPYQDWIDTGTTPPTLRIYDGAEWMAVGQVDTTAHAFLPAGLIPTGMVTPFAGAIAPSGWLLCYGQAVSRTAYATLFGAIGTTYGAGDGSTTFNVPDMRGRVAAGVDNMGGTAADRITSENSGISGTMLGAAGGDERMKLHSHEINDPGHTHVLSTSDGGVGTKGNAPNGNVGNSTGVGTYNNQFGQIITTNGTGVTIQNAGSGAAGNVQPTMMLNYIIKI